VLYYVGNIYVSKMKCLDGEIFKNVMISYTFINPGNWYFGVSALGPKSSAPTLYNGKFNLGYEYITSVYNFLYNFHTISVCNKILTGIVYIIFLLKTYITQYNIKYNPILCLKPRTKIVLFL